MKTRHQLTQSRLNVVTQRTRDIYTSIGFLSTNFSGLEAEVQDLLATLINSADSDLPKHELAQLSLKQCLDELSNTTKGMTRDESLLARVSCLCKRIAAVATKRNDVMHSSWIAYESGGVGQHRARLKGHKANEYEFHFESPTSLLDSLADEILDLIYDIARLEDDLIAETSSVLTKSQELKTE
ncbi:MAG: hypothetical protein AB7T27_05920 [Kiritimatiellia bacterium]